MKLKIGQKVVVKITMLSDTCLVFTVKDIYPYNNFFKVEENPYEWRDYEIDKEATMKINYTKSKGV